MEWHNQCCEKRGSEVNTKESEGEGGITKKAKAIYLVRVQHYENGRNLLCYWERKKEVMLLLLLVYLFFDCVVFVTSVCFVLFCSNKKKKKREHV